MPVPARQAQDAQGFPAGWAQMHRYPPPACRRLIIPPSPVLLFCPGRAPQETLLWLANPANLNSDLLPPGLETYDPLPFLSSTGNVFLVTLLPQVL